MKHQVAPASRRGRALLDDDFAPEFVRNVHMLAIRRGARDAHRELCDRDAVECEACSGHTRAIANAKWSLNHGVDPM